MKILTILFLFIGSVVFSQQLPPGYSPTYLNQENAAIFVNSSMDNGKLNISVKQTGSSDGGELVLSDGTISVRNFQFTITFENIYDSYIFLRVQNGNHITQKGPAYPGFNSCAYGSTCRLYINTDEKTFVLGPGEVKKFNAYTNQSTIVNGYYPNMYSTYIENITYYSEYYEPFCLNFPISKHFVPKDKLIYDTPTDTDFDIDELLDELEEETTIDEPETTSSSTEEEVILDQNTSVIENTVSNNTSQSQNNYDVNACNRALSETRTYYEKIYDMLVKSYQGQFDAQNIDQLINDFDNGLNYTSEAISNNQLSPECLHKLSALEDEFDQKIQAKTEELINNLGNEPSGNTKVHKYLTIPKFTTKTNSTQTYSKKSSSNTPKKNTFEDGKYQYDSKYKGPE